MWITNSVGLQELNPAFFFWVAVIVLAFGMLGLVIRSAVRGATAKVSANVERDDWGYPVSSAAQAFPVSPKSGPTRYRIVGVDKASRMEVTDVITATTPDNAKAKAELDGVLVTSVEPA
jgi:hypothetical protein